MNLFVQYGPLLGWIALFVWHLWLLKKLYTLGMYSKDSAGMKLFNTYGTIITGAYFVFAVWAISKPNIPVMFLVIGFAACIMGYTANYLVNIRSSGSRTLDRLGMMWFVVSCATYVFGFLFMISSWV